MAKKGDKQSDAAPEVTSDSRWYAYFHGASLEFGSLTAGGWDRRPTLHETEHGNMRIEGAENEPIVILVAANMTDVMVATRGHVEREQGNTTSRD